MKKEVLEILNKLEENNFEAYIVGGYVRDYILNRKTPPIWKSLISIKLSQVQISLSIFG